MPLAQQRLDEDAGVFDDITELDALPAHVELQITESEPGIKGDTASGATKPATLSTGAIVQVPLFISEGEWIKVDTRTGSYLERVKR